MRTGSWKSPSQETLEYPAAGVNLDLTGINETPPALLRSYGCDEPDSTPKDMRPQMGFPDFFADARRIELRDPLAAFLGASEGGVIAYGYEDAVKLAGHSCPTVASAYMLTVHALRALYPDAMPERGGVRVAFRGRVDEGVTGVIANVVTLLTGAAHDGGFKGLGGRFVRRGLLDFAADVPLAIRFARVDTGAAVDVQADLSSVPADPEMPDLLARCLRSPNDAALIGRFGRLWQDRVRRILIDHRDDPAIFRVSMCS